MVNKYNLPDYFPCFVDNFMTNAIITIYLFGDGGGGAILMMLMVATEDTHPTRPIIYIKYFFCSICKGVCTLYQQSQSSKHPHRSPAQFSYIYKPQTEHTKGMHIIVPACACVFLLRRWTWHPENHLTVTVLALGCASLEQHICAHFGATMASMLFFVRA